MSSEKEPDITLAPQPNGSESINSKSAEKEGQLHIVEENVLQARTIGVFGAISLTVNKIIGAGIFSTPATIFKLTGSVGMSLIAWTIGAIIASCGVCVFLEFGGGIPRSGGIKNYLERSYRPKLMQTCIYIFYCVFLQVSASNAITFSSYILIAAGVESTTAKSKGVALAGAAFAVGIHTIAPRAGRALQDVLGVVKLFTLAFIVCTGFAALGGHLKVPKPNNFTNSFEGTTNNGYNMGTAILNVLFSFGGYDNVSAVLSEVKNPVRTLKLSLPISMACISVLYLLANIAYFAAVSKTEFKNSTVTVAAVLFKNVYGESAGAKALPALVALSALGHLLGVAFTVPRLIQELAKDGVLPFSNILMENRPFRTPVMALILHLCVTILFIYAPPAGDAFNFVVSLSSYPGSVLNLALAIGLVKLRLSKKENWTSPFKAPWAIIALYVIANSFLVIMPFVRPPNGKGNTSLPYWLSSVVPLGILGLGIVYYLVRFEALPRVFGYQLVTVRQELRDGSSVSRYRRVKGEKVTI